MKLALHFDGSVGINALRQAILAAGENTTIHYSAGHGLDASDLLAVLSAAGSEKNLVLGFDGARLEARNLQQAVSFAGDRTRVVVSAAQAVNLAALVSAVSAAGDGKALRVAFSGSQAKGDALKSVLEAAGRQVDVGLGATQSLSLESLLATLDAAGDERRLALELNGALPSANLLQAIEAAGASTGITINAAQSLELDQLPVLQQAAGDGKHLSLSFNGAQLEEGDLAKTVAASGTNSLVRVHSAEALNIGRLLAAIEATGNTRQLGLDFSGTQVSTPGLLQAVEAAGISTTLAVNSAQSMATDDLLAALGAAADVKALDLQCTGSQLPVEKLQRLVGGAGQRASLSVNGAQALPLTALLGVMEVAA